MWLVHGLEMEVTEGQRGCGTVDTDRSNFSNVDDVVLFREGIYHVFIDTVGAENVWGILKRVLNKFL